MSAALYLNVLSIFVVLLFAVLVFAKYEFKQQRLADIQKGFLLRVYHLRLSNMLTFLGIDIQKYVKNMSPKDVAQHIRQCQACTHTSICDSCLRDGKKVSNMNFCPNFDSLRKHGRILYQKP